MGVLGSIGRLAEGVASGVETGSQIRTRNAAAQEQEDRARRAREEDESSKAYMDIGGQFVEGAMIPEGMEPAAYFAQLNSKRQSAAAEAAAQAQANSLGGRMQSALAGIRSRGNVRTVGEAAGVTGGGVGGPTPPAPPAEPPPPKMRPMTAREAAEGRALAARSFNRKDAWEQTSKDFVAETIKERATEMSLLPAAEMGPAFSRFANGAKIEIVPNPSKDGEETFQFKMNGNVVEGNVTRAGIVQLAGQFAEHDMEGAFKVLGQDRIDRQRRQTEALKLQEAEENLKVARHNRAQAEKMDPLKYNAAVRAEQAAIQALDDTTFYNDRRYTFLHNPERAEQIISAREAAADKNDPAVWGKRPMRDAQGKVVMNADNEPVMEEYSVLREEWNDQKEMARNNYYRNYMKPAMSPSGVPVWQLTDAAGNHVFANRSYGAVMEHAQRKWGGKPPPSVKRPAAAPAKAPAKAPTAAAPPAKTPAAAGLPRRGLRVGDVVGAR